MYIHTNMYITYVHIYVLLVVNGVKEISRVRHFLWCSDKKISPFCAKTFSAFLLMQHFCFFLVASEGPVHSFGFVVKSLLNQANLCIIPFFIALFQHARLDPRDTPLWTRKTKSTYATRDTRFLQTTHSRQPMYGVGTESNKGGQSFT